MKEEKKTKSNERNRIIIIIVIALLLAIGVLHSLADKDNQNNTDHVHKQNTIASQKSEKNETISDKTAAHLSNQVIDIQKYVSLTEEKEGNKTYSIDIIGFSDDNGINEALVLNEYNIVLKYQIDNNNITMKLTDNSSYKKCLSYDIYINDNYVNSDTALYRNPKIHSIGKYLVYPEIATYNIHLSIVDKNGNTKHIGGDLDPDYMKKYNVAGIRGDDYSIDKNKIIVAASRDNNGTIEYNSTIYDLTVNDIQQELLTKIPDLIITATYIYTLDDEKLDLTPEIIDEVPLKDYVNSYKNNN